MAHPVRPDSFIEISNFYTMTVYEKGAEVVRMLNTLLGDDAFYRGAKLYFERFDGMAVTCDDFVDAMQEASGKDLSQFRRWYEQAGTPIISVDATFNEASGQLDMTLTQRNPPTPGQDSKPPLHIPVALSLLVDGKHLDSSSGLPCGQLFKELCSQFAVAALRVDFSQLKLGIDRLGVVSVVAQYRTERALGCCLVAAQ